MQPITLTIPGDYWDCHLYRGRLYLWKMDGRLSVYNWDQIVDRLPVEPSEQFALRCAFSRGDYLYGPGKAVLGDPDIAGMLRSKFESLSEREWTVSRDVLHDTLQAEVDNPFMELPTDVEIYNSEVFAATESGLWKTRTHLSGKRFIEPEPTKLWDCQLYSIRASTTGGRLALAAGGDGLFQYHEPSYGYYLGLDRSAEIEPGLVRVHEDHSSVANWSYASIYSSSYVGSGYMATFDSRQRQRKGQREYTFLGVHRQDEIFEGGNGFSWGTQDKIYRARAGGLDVVHFSQKHLQEGEPFGQVTHLPFQQWKGEIIGGGVALFGVIVQCENAVVVIRSDSERSFNIPGRVGRWRVYSRSNCYENHLHVIGENDLTVYSFNHDYFVTQANKQAGIRWLPFAWNAS